MASSEERIDFPVPLRAPQQCRGSVSLLTASTGSLNPQPRGKEELTGWGSALLPREEQAHVPLQAAQKHPLKAGNSPPVQNKASQHSDMLPDVHCCHTAPRGWAMGREMGTSACPTGAQVVPNPSHGDVALVQPTLGWQKIPGPESLPASHRLH